VPAGRNVGRHLQFYVEFSPRQKSGSFSLNEVLAKLQEGGGSRR
jgi:arylsulfatase